MVAKGTSKRLVIDASVARSAGDEGATYPTSVHCRDFLLAVLDICHTLVMTPDIKEEWNKHQSRFARKWRSKMVAKGKFEFLDIPINEELWTRYQVRSIVRAIVSNVSGVDKFQDTDDFYRVIGIC